MSLGMFGHQNTIWNWCLLYSRLGFSPQARHAVLSSIGPRNLSSSKVPQEFLVNYLECSDSRMGRSISLVFCDWLIVVVIGRLYSLDIDTCNPMLILPQRIHLHWAFLQGNGNGSVSHSSCLCSAKKEAWRRENSTVRRSRYNVWGSPLCRQAN